MSKDIPKKVIDITGVEVTPGEPTVCLGNGEQGFECCCDECDYYLLCFPKFDPKSKRINKTKIPPLYYDKSNAKALLISAYQKSFAYLPGDRKKPSPVGEGGRRSVTEGACVI